MKNLKRIATSLIAVVILMSATNVNAQQTVIFDTHLNSVVSSNSSNLPVDSIHSDTTIVSDTTLQMFSVSKKFTHNIPTTFNKYTVVFKLTYKYGSFDWNIDTNNTRYEKNTASNLDVYGPVSDTLVLDSGSNIKYEITHIFNSGRYELNSTIMHTVDTIFINSMSTSLFNNTKNEVEFTLFPNPTVNDLNINFDNTVNKDVVFTIFDMSGRMVKTGNLNNNRNTIDVLNLNHGTYITVLNLGTNKVTKRFVKQ